MISWFNASFRLWKRGEYHSKVSPLSWSFSITQIIQQHLFHLFEGSEDYDGELPRVTFRIRKSIIQLLELLLQASSSSSTVLVFFMLIIIKILLWCWEIVKDWLWITNSKYLNTWSSDRFFESNSPFLSAVDQHKDNRPPACILCTCRWATCAGKPRQGSNQSPWSYNWLRGEEKRDAHLCFPLVVTITSRFRPRLIC